MEDTTHDEDSEPTETRKKRVRASKRRKVAKAPVTPGNNKSEPTDSVPKDQVARTDDRRVKGRRGHLKQMTEIPLDILHEIFRDLDLTDLLHLSWASKSLRAIVMAKEARYIWEEVRILLL